ncbi:hypothetical protein I8751_01680 [Nostocaceae cyanobacterium CENA357]|uniref:Uncharacterized protein n=1 Tax=Atlanticothrix silvestris CENA357 TaxID=1725252 RepID=A0A8J7L1K1_9CYAN|nr:hypothetical protein [Atlanticothrix silvestris CENA357]
MSQRGKAARSWGKPPRATAAPLVGLGEPVRCGGNPSTAVAPHERLAIFAA